MFAGIFRVSPVGIAHFQSRCELAIKHKVHWSDSLICYSIKLRLKYLFLSLRLYCVWNLQLSSRSAFSTSCILQSRVFLFDASRFIHYVLVSANLILSFCSWNLHSGRMFFSLFDCGHVFFELRCSCFLTFDFSRAFQHFWRTLFFHVRRWFS